MNAEDRVPVTLTAQQWNQVLGMLAEQPYRAAFPLIQQIQMQCNQWGNGAAQEPQPLTAHQLRTGDGNGAE